MLLARCFVPPMLSQGFPGAISGIVTVPRCLGTAGGSCALTSRVILSLIRTLPVWMSGAFQRSRCLSCPPRSCCPARLLIIHMFYQQCSCIC